MHGDSIGSAFAPFLCFIFVFLRQYAVILFSGFFCFFVQFVFFMPRYVSYEAVSYLGEDICAFLFSSIFFLSKISESVLSAFAVSWLISLSILPFMVVMMLSAMAA